MSDPFTHLPVLSDGVFALSPLAYEDIKALTRAASDPAIWAGHPAKDRWKPEVFRPYAETLLRLGGTMVIRDRAGHVIGCSRFYRSPDTPGDICIGFTFLIRQHWGGETNRAVKRIMCDYAFSHVPKVWFHIAPGNLRSQVATSRLGARREPALEVDLGTGPQLWVRMALLPDQCAWGMEGKDVGVF